VCLVLQWERGVSSLWMTWTCRPGSSMEHSLPSSCSDCGWTMAGGMLYQTPLTTSHPLPSAHHPHLFHTLASTGVTRKAQVRKLLLVDVHPVHGGCGPSRWGMQPHHPLDSSATSTSSPSMSSTIRQWHESSPLSLSTSRSVTGVVYYS